MHTRGREVHEGATGQDRVAELLHAASDGGHVAHGAPRRVVLEGELRASKAGRSGAERGEVASYYAERVAWSPRACCAGSSLYSTAARRENRKILLPGFHHALKNL